MYSRAEIAVSRCRYETRAPRQEIPHSEARQYVRMYCYRNLKLWHTR